MRDRVALATQHQSSQRGEAAFAAGRAFVVHATEPTVVCSDHTIQRNGGIPCFARAEIILHHAHDGGLRSLFAFTARAHAVRNRANRTKALATRLGKHRRTKIFVDELFAR